MRQQLADLAGTLRGQALQHVFDVDVGVVPVELGRLDQAGDGDRALTGFVYISFAAITASRTVVMNVTYAP